MTFLSMASALVVVAGGHCEAEPAWLACPWNSLANKPWMQKYHIGTNYTPDTPDSLHWVPRRLGYV